MEPNTDSKEGHHDHYSVDEMMDRLKRHKRAQDKQDETKDGELITRSDGTQAIKVRKRKRRSKKAPKENNPRLKWAAIGIVSGLTFLSVVFTMFIITMYNGGSFKEKTAISITKLLKANSTQLDQLRVTPISAKVFGAEVSWGNETFFQEATFSSIKADIRATSFFSSSWHGNEMLSKKGQIQLQIPEQNRAQNIGGIRSNYRFQAYRCEDLDVSFGAHDTVPAIKGAHATLQQLPNRRYQVSFNKGSLNIPHWPELTISSGIVTLHSSNAEIEARLKANNDHKGEIIIKGIVYKDKDQPIVLDVKSINYPLEDILGKGLGHMIKGEINSDMGSISYTHGQKEEGDLSFIMPFNSNQLHISELPMLNDLRDLTGKSNYLHPSFSFCRGSIIRSRDGVSLRNLNLISSQLLSIKGDITVDHEGNLSGELEIGIPSRLFDDKAPAPAIFSSPKDGNIHTKIKLGGTIHNPHDNLNARLRSSHTSILSKPLSFEKPSTLNPHTPQETSKQKVKAFEELTQ
ncbi:MAG: hypothetical protein P8P36_07275 [Akkermansiaceae bacterium]|nr:hypothetical protein [Akkermansiaceae bacterium]